MLQSINWNEVSQTSWNIYSEIKPNLKIFIIFICLSFKCCFLCTYFIEFINLERENVEYLT